MLYTDTLPNEKMILTELLVQKYSVKEPKKAFSIKKHPKLLVRLTNLRIVLESFTEETNLTVLHTIALNCVLKLQGH